MNDSAGELPPRSAKRTPRNFLFPSSFQDYSALLSMRYKQMLTAVFFSYLFSHTVKRYIRKGIPPALRGEVRRLLTSDFVEQETGSMDEEGGENVQDGREGVI